VVWGGNGIHSPVTGKEVSSERGVSVIGVVSVIGRAKKTKLFRLRRRCRIK
jgi:hypothetical protein